ncbi:MAG TPA: hypothetical protein VF136_05210 [Methylomirabilota bacterium]
MPTPAARVDRRPGAASGRLDATASNRSTAWWGSGAAALGLTLAIAWINLSLTGRWADVPGALHGARLPLYAALLVFTTAGVIGAMVRGRSARDPFPATLATAGALGGALLLAAALLTTFPPATWTQIPFYDDWPGLLQLTVNGIDLLSHGALTGWQWAFLGGYHTSADLSQSLAVPALLPIAAFGPAAGFHVFLALVVLAIPLAVYIDLRLEGDERAARVAAALSAIVVAGYFATVMRSGMANSAAGAAFVALAVAGSHAARRGRRWGAPLLVLALTLTLYSHAAFFLYGALVLAVEALFVRDRATAVRTAVGLGAAFLAALPLHWELFRHPDWFVTNNLYFDTPAAFDWAGLARQIFYATEILVRPGRWFNDYVGLTHVALPVILWMAWRDRSRAGFYAWATLALVVSLRFNAPQLGIISSRQMHLLPVVVAPVLAGFLYRHAPGGWPLRASLIALVGVFVAVPFAPLPHVPDVRAFDPALVDRIASRDGHLVLLENNPHWDMISAPDHRTERSRFDVHYEALLPAATGRWFFGQPQDGYHRSRFRGYSLAGGGFRGQPVGEAVDLLAAELKRWGVRWLLVWSGPSIQALSADGRFRRGWSAGPWVEFELIGADPRAVVTASGAGTIRDATPVGAEIALAGVRRGDEVVVRTHYFPAWSASWNGQAVALRAAGDQMAFDAPADGDAVVALRYDRRPWLTMLAIAGLAAGWLAAARTTRR